MVESNQKFSVCLKKLHENETFTHYDWKDQTCWFKEGYVSTKDVVYTGYENSICAYHPEKIATVIDLGF